MTITSIPPVRAFLTLLLLLTFVTGAHAQIPGTPGAAPAEATTETPKDPLGRDTPQGLVAGLIRALSDGDYDRAVRFFETDTMGAGVGRLTLSGATLARRFQEVLDRAGSVITPAELSADPGGRVDDGLAEDLDPFGTLRMPDGGTKPLLAARVERDGKSVWVVSTSTLADIQALASASVASGTTPLIGWIPAGPSVFGAPVAHWGALLVVLCLSFAVAWVLTAARGVFVMLVRRFYGETKLTRFVDASAAPARLLITTIIFGIAIHSTGVSVLARYYAMFLTQIAAGFAVAWLLWRIADAGVDFALGQMSRRGQLTAYSAVSFLNRAFKALLAVLFIAALLHAFGVNITTGLAALGIGGLAVALGAQKLFENLIGSLTVIADRPVRIGDFCGFGDKLGTIEDIGIRSTRIRTLDRTVVTVPNGEFASLQIENYTQRDRYWFHPTLNLRYETSTDQIRYLLQELRAMLYAHPKVDPDPARVRLTALSAYSIDIEVFAYVHGRDYQEFLEIQEDLLLRCMEIVEKSGSGFAFPSQTLYLGRDGGLDEEKSKEAEETVRRRREKGEMQVPKFRPETIRELRDTIEYPPRGAAVGGKPGR
jgi:MscS family membrane protein